MVIVKTPYTMGSGWFQPICTLQDPHDLDVAGKRRRANEHGPSMLEDELDAYRQKTSRTTASSSVSLSTPSLRRHNLRPEHPQ